MQEKKAVFIDRDGVIVVEREHLHRKEDLTLIPKAAEAIKLLNDSGYLAIVVSNQPVVARDLCTIAELEDINKYLESLLFKKSGSRLDRIYYCPHHPNPKGKIGINGPNQDYVGECECRKPKQGIILQAGRDFGLDLSNSFMIGDKLGDIESGVRARCKTVLVKTGYGGKGGEEPVYMCTPTFESESLYTAVEYIMTAEKEEKEVRNDRSKL
ncbi:MAG: HAD family hydrolase [Nanoarchaeota archaeon]